MKSTFRLSSLLFAAAALCMAVAHKAYEPIHDVAVAAARFVGRLVFDGLKLAAADPETTKPAVWFVQAKAFMLRILKRERPVLSPTWRMCPST